MSVNFSWYICMLFIINLAFILNGKHPVHSDLYHLISLSQLSFLPFGWDTTIRSKLSHVILCREDCSFSSWCYAWKKLYGLLWWERRRWITCWTIKVGFCYFYMNSGALFSASNFFNPLSIILLLVISNNILFAFNFQLFLSSDIIFLHLIHIIFSPFLAGRYHSLVIEKESFPHDELEATAWTEDGLIMAARHKKYKHLQVTS